MASRSFQAGAKHGRRGARRPHKAEAGSSEQSPVVARTQSAAFAEQHSVGNVVIAVNTHSKKRDAVVTALCGSFIEQGTHHGKTCYRKLGGDVYLYFWDRRDGIDLSGWWFGDQIGGTNCWARAKTHASKPPKTGWRVPWYAPSKQSGELVVNLACSRTRAGAPPASINANIAPSIGAGVAVKMKKVAQCGQDYGANQRSIEVELADTKASPSKQHPRGTSMEPEGLSLDERCLWAMAAREDAEIGADKFNALTFGEDAGAGWSFEENLAAVEKLAASHEPLWDQKKQPLTKRRRDNTGVPLCTCFSWSAWNQSCVLQ